MLSVNKKTKNVSFHLNRKKTFLWNLSTETDKMKLVNFIFQTKTKNILKINIQRGKRVTELRLYIEVMFWIADSKTSCILLQQHFLLWKSNANCKHKNSSFFQRGYSKKLRNNKKNEINLSLNTVFSNTCKTKSIARIKNLQGFNIC